MLYSPPSGNVVNLTLHAFTPPAGNAANLTLIDGAILTLSLSDTMTVTEGAFTRAMTRILDDTATVTDTLSKFVGYFRTLTDTITLSDTIGWGLTKTFSDTITMSERFKRLLNGVSVLWTKATRGTGTWSKVVRSVDSWVKRSKQVT